MHQPNNHSSHHRKKPIMPNWSENFVYCESTHPEHIAAPAASVIDDPRETNQPPSPDPNDRIRILNVSNIVNTVSTFQDGRSVHIYKQTRTTLALSFEAPWGPPSNLYRDLEETLPDLKIHAGSIIDDEYIFYFDHRDETVFNQHFRTDSVDKDFGDGDIFTEDECSFLR